MRRLPHWMLLMITTGCSQPDAMTDATTDGSTTASSTGEATDTGTPTTGTGEPVTTGDTGTADATTEDEPTAGPEAVCGDGSVDGEEPCDDGNDVPDDGCDQRCERTGVPLWTISWDAGYGLDNEGAEIAIDEDGNLYVAGGQLTEPKLRDAVVRKLDPNGVEIDRIEHGGEQSQTVQALAVGPDGSVYMGGQEQADGLTRGYLHKYDAAGELQWAFVRATDVVDGAALVSDVIVDGDGVYVSGAEHVGDLDTFQLFLHRLDDATGAIAWEVERGDIPGLAYSDLASAPDGSVYMASFQTQGDEYQPTLARYTADGDPVYQKIYETTLGGFAGAVAVHTDGSVALVGGRYTSDNGLDAWLARIDDIGEIVWEKTRDQDHDGDSLHAVAWSSAGDLYVGGKAVVTNHQDDAFVARYTGTGEPIWTSLYDDEQSLSDQVLGLVVGADAIVVVGEDFVLSEGYNQWIRAYQP